MHNSFLVDLYFLISTCFGRIWAHHQEKQMCLCGTWYLLFCVESTLHARQSSTQNNKYQLSHNQCWISWLWAHSRPKHVEIEKYKYTNKTFCTKLVYLQDYCSLWLSKLKAPSINGNQIKYNRNVLKAVHYEGLLKHIFLLFILKLLLWEFWVL